MTFDENQDPAEAMEALKFLEDRYGHTVESDGEDNWARLAAIEKAMTRRHPLMRYRLEFGRLVPDPAGQWIHVEGCGVRSWKLDPATFAERAELDAAEERDPSPPWNAGGDYR